VALEDGDFRRLHHGGSQESTAPLGHLPFPRALAAVGLYDIEAGDRDELACSPLALGVKDRQDLGQDRRSTLLPPAHSKRPTVK